MANRNPRLAVALLIVAANAACGGRASTADQNGGSGTGGSAGAAGSTGTGGSGGMTPVEAGSDAPACGVIRASDHDRSCMADSDCALVWEGDSCTAKCSCSNATINQAALAGYHYPALFPQRVGCFCILPGPLVCAAGVCTICPVSGCPVKDGGSDGSAVSDAVAPDAGLGSDCSALADALHLAVGRATACDITRDDCDGTSTLIDECNCVHSTNRTLPTDAQEARTAYQAWFGAGCTAHCDAACWGSVNPYGYCFGYSPPGVCGFLLPL
jgi:hypothetical protein